MGTHEHEMGTHEQYSRALVASTHFLRVLVEALDRGKHEHMVGVTIAQPTRLTTHILKNNARINVYKLVWYWNDLLLCGQRASSATITSTQRNLINWKLHRAPLKHATLLHWDQTLSHDTSMWSWLGSSLKHHKFEARRQHMFFRIRKPYQRNFKPISCLTLLMQIHHVSDIYGTSSLGSKNEIRTSHLGSYLISYASFAQCRDSKSVNKLGQIPLQKKVMSLSYMLRAVDLISSMQPAKVMECGFPNSWCRGFIYLNDWLHGWGRARPSKSRPHLTVYFFWRSMVESRCNWIQGWAEPQNLYSFRWISGKKCCQQIQISVFLIKVSVD